MLAPPLGLAERGALATQHRLGRGDKLPRRVAFGLGPRRHAVVDPDEFFRLRGARLGGVAGRLLVLHRCQLGADLRFDRGDLLGQFLLFLLRLGRGNLRQRTLRGGAVAVHFVLGEVVKVGVQLIELGHRDRIELMLVTNRAAQ